MSLTLFLGEKVANLFLWNFMDVYNALSEFYYKRANTVKLKKQSTKFPTQFNPFWTGFAFSDMYVRFTTILQHKHQDIVLNNTVLTNSPLILEFLIKNGSKSGNVFLFGKK